MNFSEVIHENLVTSSRILAKMLSKYKKILYSLTLFGVRYQGIAAINTFTDSL